jgi:hypothetical protein
MDFFYMPESEDVMNPSDNDRFGFTFQGDISKEL